MPLQRRPNPQPQPQLHPHPKPQHPPPSSQRPSSYRKHAVPPSPPPHHRNLGPARLSPRRELARVQQGQHHDVRARTSADGKADPRPQLPERKFSFDVVHPWEVRDRHGAAQLKVINGAPAPASVDWDREVVAANVVRRPSSSSFSSSSSSSPSSPSSSVHTEQPRHDGKPVKDVVVPRPQQQQRSPRVTSRKAGLRPVVNLELLHPGWKPRANAAQPRPQARQQARQARPRYYKHFQQGMQQQVGPERTRQPQPRTRMRYYQNLSTGWTGGRGSE